MEVPARMEKAIPMSGHGRRACVGLAVGDLDALYQRWNSHIDGLNAPIDQPWGARTIGFQDPADNTVFVMGSVRGRSES